MSFLLKLNKNDQYDQYNKKNYKIVYIKEGDKSGRSLLFGYNDFNTTQSGVGAFSVLAANSSKDSSDFTYIVGAFEKWEFIPNSKDRFIHTYNPITNENLQKTRVCFENCPLGINTKIRVTNLDLLDQNLERSSDFYNDFANLTQEQMAMLFQKGDAVLLTPYFPDGLKGKKLLDDNGVSYIATIYIRRYGGLATLLKELTNRIND